MEVFWSVGGTDSFVLNPDERGIQRNHSPNSVTGFASLLRACLVGTVPFRSPIQMTVPLPFPFSSENWERNGRLATMKCINNSVPKWP